MEDRLTLQSCLGRAAPHTTIRAASVVVIEALARAAVDLAAMISAGPLAGITGEAGALNADELELPEIFDEAAPLCVAIDPLDGSANLENNISVGTIFSIRPKGHDAISTFFEPGTAQCAAGFFIYGPQTLLVLALDAQVDVFILDARSGAFVLMKHGVQVPADTPEFAINASNRRHWSSAVRRYIDGCLAGVTGEQAGDFNMRWIGSLVAEAYRILGRGGVFLYPADARPAYREGRLRLVYEAHPIALIMEWAGGAASDGRARILELSARTPHQRVPLVMGSALAVRDVNLIHDGFEPLFENNDAPLFARRGLFR
jgi:fructose-1,6-bisphosphatase I